MFFDDDTSDFAVVLWHFILGAIVFVPTLLLYFHLKNSGLLNENDTQLFISAVLLTITFVGFALVSGDDIMDFEVLYVILSLGAVIIWIGGTVTALQTVITPEGELMHEFSGNAEKWFVTLVYTIFSLAGFSCFNMFLRSIDWIDNQVQNIIASVIFVAVSVLTVVFMMTGLTLAVEIIMGISLIPFVIQLVSMIVGGIREY